MRPLLIDEGLPSSVARALRELELPVWAVGEVDEGAPPRESDDEENCQWCANRGAVMITNDRGRENPIILRALQAHRVPAVFVYKDLRTAPPHRLASALLRAEAAIDDFAGSRSPEPRRLYPNGRLKRR